VEQGNGEPTRAMETGAAIDRTVLQGGAAGATQMGQTITCAVCGTTNTGIDLYCRDCGFLLASEPGVEVHDDTQAAPVLTLVDKRTGREYPLRPGVNTVGRESSDVMLIDGSVSRRHAEIAVEHETAIVNDLGSTNGSRVNGDVLEPNRARPARAGAELTFGNTVLTLEIESVPVGGETGPIEIPGLAIGDIELQAALDPLPEQPSLEVPEEPGAEPVTVARLRSLVRDRDDILIIEGATTIGRKADNTVSILGDPYVSSRHARIDCEGGSVYLTDTGSTNGTTLNGQKLVASVRVQLASGDQLAIGQGRYAFEPVVQPAEDEHHKDGEDQPI
jgi:pSer/pThr/pTyr-binding forkhead associated (FHA) protein